MMKKRTNKGMALASTLIMMTIVLMMSTLMMTVTLYGTQVTGVHRQTVEDRVVLDALANRFLQNKEDPDSLLIALKTENNDTVIYVDAVDNECDELTLSNGVKAIKGKIDGINMKIVCKNTADETVFTVYSAARSSTQLMKIVCDKTVNARTGVVTVTLRSWEYR